VYHQGGIYEVILKVTDSWNLSGQDTLIVIVGKPPVADIGFRGQYIEASVGELILFNGTNSYDPDGHITNWSWYFGDGDTSYGEIVSHSYSEPGSYVVTLTVMDNDTLTASDNCTVNVIPAVNQPPVAIISYPPTDDCKFYTNESIIFDGSNSYDPDELPLRETDDNDTELDAPHNLTFYWTFGDGSSALGAKALHKYSIPGIYIVTLRVTDKFGATGIANRTVTIVARVIAAENKLPIADAGDKLRKVKVNEVVYFDGSNSTDPDGKIVNWSWDFGDGSPKAYGIRVTHRYMIPARYKVTLAVQDDLGDTAEDYVFVVVEPMEPPSQPIEDIAEELLTYYMTIGYIIIIGLIIALLVTAIVGMAKIRSARRQKRLRKS
jgi:PKD repeat protein